MGIRINISTRNDFYTLYRYMITTLWCTFGEEKSYWLSFSKKLFFFSFLFFPIWMGLAGYLNFSSHTWHTNTVSRVFVTHPILLYLYTYELNWSKWKYTFPEFKKPWEFLIFFLEFWTGFDDWNLTSQKIYTAAVDGI